MKRFEDCLSFSEARKLPTTPEYLKLLFEHAGITKGYSLVSRMNNVHFTETIIGNLTEAFMFQRNLALPISTPVPTPKVKNKIIDGLIKLGAISEVRKGYSFKTSNLEIPKSDLTKIEPSKQILNAFDPCRAKITKAWSIVIRQGNKESLLKSNSEDHSLLFKAASAFQKRINVPLNGFKRIFNSDELSGGRIYSNYQQMSKECRSLITIDGEQTVELDYRYNQIRMLFALSDVNDVKDPYSDFTFDREIVKKAMNTLINASSPKRVFCDMRYSAPFRWASNEADTFISEAYSRYPILKQMQGSKIGLKLQKIEGDIALAIMKETLYNSNVVLPVHDAFIVKISQAEYFNELMTKTWDKIVGASKI